MSGSRDEVRVASRAAPKEAASGYTHEPNRWLLLLMSSEGFQEGFYAVFFSGSSGEGYAVLIFRSGRISGADPLGVTFDGTYLVGADSFLEAKVHVSVPADGQVIQGATSGPSGMAYDVPLRLPADFVSQPFVRIETPLGPVNARFKWLRAVE